MWGGESQCCCSVANGESLRACYLWLRFRSEGQRGEREHPPRIEENACFRFSLCNAEPFSLRVDRPRCHGKRADNLPCRTISGRGKLAPETNCRMSYSCRTDYRQILTVLLLAIGTSEITGANM